VKVVITGGGGFLGRRLAQAIVRDPRIERIVLADVLPPSFSTDDGKIIFSQVDLASATAAASISQDADVIFHLAAIVSGQAEADFEVGMRVNLDGTRHLLDAARAGGRSPRFVFASSLAVFGPPLPQVVTEETAVSPQSSYGAQKAIGELLVSEYSRRGFVDGRVLRLPTVCVRPGRPNAAASSFVSSIIREPLHGEKSVCPLGRDAELWLSSPGSAVANLVHGSLLASDLLGASRTINLPGITVTIGEMLAALERVSGAEALTRIEFRDVPEVRRIIAGWPARFDVRRSLALGFRQDVGFEAIIQEFIRDEATVRQAG
jgi:D-erythronate 2-dehydrogenase